MARIGFAITSSYCTIEEILKEVKLLREEGHEIIPIVSEGVIKNDTRFGKAEDIKKKIEEATTENIVSTIVEAEKFGAKDKLDLIVVAPATGNFVAKMASGITDTAVTMAVKATMRNNKPVVIGVSTNDGLGFNGQNITKLINSKNIYFIPFGQDDPVNKPNSLIAHYELLPDTVNAALNGQQIQPILKEYSKK